MLTTIRAGISALLLIGFYLYALVVAAVFLLITAIASYLTGAVIGALILLTLAVPFAVLVATWRVLRMRPAPEPGLVVDEKQAPQLWAEARRIAQAVGTRLPDEIRLVGDVNAAVSEHTRLLGLIGGRRYLYVGVPLLQSLTVDQLRSVIAHEMGHYAGGHVRLGNLVYRGGAAIDQTIMQIGPDRIGGLLLRPYRLLYLAVSLSVRRRQELEADRAAVRVAGRAATASALREMPGLAAAWGFYLDAYVAQGLEAGLAPAGILRSFPILLRERADETDEIRNGALPSHRSRWDSHPAIAQRIVMILASVPSQRTAEPVPDGRPATALLPAMDELIDATELAVFDFGGRARLPFAEYTAASTQYRAQQTADALYRASGRIAGAGADRLSAVVNLLGAGRMAELADALAGPGRPGTRVAVADHLGDAFAASLVAAGAASWHHSWREPVALRTPDGAPLPVNELVEAAMAGRAWEVAQRLTSLGVDMDAVAAVKTRATADGGEPIGGVVNIVVDKRRSDLVIYHNGLMVVPGMPRLKMSMVKARMREMLTSIPPEDLAARAGHRFIPYEEISRCRLVRRTPLRYDLELHGGRKMTVRTGFESEEIGPGYQALAQMLGAIGTRG